jgi:hypothetical protein
MIGTLTASLSALNTRGALNCLQHLVYELDAQGKQLRVVQFTDCELPKPAGTQNRDSKTCAYGAYFRLAVKAPRAIQGCAEGHSGAAVPNQTF